MLSKPGRPARPISDEYLSAVYKIYLSHTTREVAEMYKVSMSTVARWVRLARDRGLNVPLEEEFNNATAQK